MRKEPSWDRFWRKVRPTGFCWEWTGSKNPRGYGTFRHEGRTASAHRVSWELLMGSIPEGLVIDHLCRNRGCVNPDHFDLVTQRVNMERSSPRLKSHCKRGHEFNKENSVINNRGHRVCNACRRAKYSTKVTASRVGA